MLGEHNISDCYLSLCAFLNCLKQDDFQHYDWSSMYVSVFF